MKKKTKLQTAAGEDDAKSSPVETRTRQHGPPKEKTQITIRVDQQLINEAYAQMQEDNTRITDIIERGLMLALIERNHQLPVWNKQVRFMVANATREQQALIRGLLIAMVEPLLDQRAYRKDTKVGKLIEARNHIVHGVSPTPEAEKLYELVCWFLEGRNKSPHASAALEYYSRYGKSAGEIAELGTL